MQTFVTIILLLSLGYCDSYGEDTTQRVFPTIGQRIRVEYDTTVTKRFLLFFKYGENKKLTLSGNLSKLTYDSLMVEDVRRDSVLRLFALTSVRNLHVSLGEQRATMSGLKLGTLTGMIVILPLYLGVPSSSDDFEESRFHQRSALLVASFATIGGIIGYFTREDKWESVDKDLWRNRGDKN